MGKIFSEIHFLRFFTPFLLSARYLEHVVEEKGRAAMWLVGDGLERDSGEARLNTCAVSLRNIDMDLIYLAIAAVFFLLSGWLISALDRL
ncbi:MAG TPA: hypothetical protein PLY42_08305 [Nitrospira sp.]|nr:hypothetical protein [Nitrospira sp.]MCW5794140.1 hypothetical protein [Nitrospira sp.]HMU30194.1 hypothetical protein [Nitrospira sp.]HMV57068.1 hypothetical protein [Nitrospira sp.]HMW85453.1 hypothetical protein [Nitrospira sp.]